MKQMKRALAAALAAALLAGCAGQEAGQSVSAPPASESAPQTDGAAVEQLLNGEHALTALPSGYMDIPLTQTGQGMYEFVNLEDRYLLCYVDYAAGTRAPLCDAAGCAHADESCPAYSPYYRNVGLAGDWLLTSGTNADGTCSMDARRLDGSEKRTLFTGAEGDSLYPWGFAMEGDKVWLAKDGKAVLLDPETGETEEGAELPEEFASGAAFGSGLLHGFSDGKELLEEYYQPSGDLKADMQQQEEILSETTFTVTVWNPRTGEEVPLLSWDNGKWQSLSCWNNKEILFSKAQGRFEAWDLATGETTVLAENWPENQFIVVGCVWDDHLMLETMWKAEPDNIDTWRECLFALDLVSGELTEITLRNHGGWGTTLPRIMGESEDMFYVISHGADTEYITEEMAVISKADYYAGVDSMQPIKDVF
ncbi:hypothetical protein [Candidatus Allofournierella excrementavium]|uniref:hypothetical protein n=1 Tax=Candidatus Allofournierella excrementavium TaxID=2838591 RepID=UPI003A83E5C8